jgi:hypothetical protein
MTTGKPAAILSLATVLGALASLPSYAEEPATLETFSATCSGADTMLLGDAVAGLDTGPVMEALCGCLATEFSGFTQPEIDMLTSDLAGTATDESRKAYADYEALAGKAAEGFEACLATDEVTAAVNDMTGSGAE